MRDVKERIARVEQVAASSHKRLDEHGAEIKSLRESRHEHANLLHNHTGILAGMNTSVNELTVAVGKISNIINKAIWMSLGGMAVGTTLIGVLGYMFYIGYNAVKVFIKL